jgi:hypothetical protein
MLGKLLRFIADVVPARLLFDELMETIGYSQFIIETVGSDGEGFTAGSDFTERCATV